MKDHWFQRYVLPGLIFQSAVIGGAYGSGRELAEFFLGHGPIGGLLGMTVTMVIFSIVLMAAYEFSRKFRLFDYQSFSQRLLGPAWPIYEILYFMIMILVISVVGAAAGEILGDAFGFPEIVGTVSVMVLTALLVFYGTPGVERFLGLWSFVLYGTYISFFGWHLFQNGAEISAKLASSEIIEGWALSGVAYSGYNMATIPALLFCIRHQHRRRESFIAGALAGPLAMIPAMLFFIAMIGQYDQLREAGGDGLLPISILIGALEGAEFFVYLFPVVLFGTFVETGAALIHGVNERLSNRFVAKNLQMANWMRSGVALLILTTAVILADAMGLTNLIAKGYGTITWGFLLVFVLPLLTYGVWQIFSDGQEHGA